MKKKKFVEITDDFDSIADGFQRSSQNAIIKQNIIPYKCKHIHGERGQIIEVMTPENAQMFNSASVTISDDAGSLSGNVFSETEWNFCSIGDGMFSVQTLNGVDVYDEYVDNPIGTYDHVSLFVNGLGVVGKNGLLGIIDKKGQEIVPIQYKDNSFEPARYSKVEQFEVLKGVIVAVGDSTIDVYSKRGEKLYVADKNGYDTAKASHSPTRRFITYLSRIESLREIYNDIHQNNYNETTIKRLNARIDKPINDLICHSFGSVEKYERFITELDKINGREKDPFYKQVKSEKYKKRLEVEIERNKYCDPC